MQHDETRYIHFILRADHLARGQALLMLRAHTKGVIQSNTNEIDCIRKNDFIPPAPHVNILYVIHML